MPTHDVGPVAVAVGRESGRPSHVAATLGPSSTAAAHHLALPNPAGARARPTAPASAASANKYGITRNN